MSTGITNTHGFQLWLPLYQANMSFAVLLPYHYDYYYSKRLFPNLLAVLDKILMKVANVDEPAPSL